MSYLMLQYDIPDKLGYPNPSCKLRRRCIRTTASVWVVRAGEVPYNLLSDWAGVGIRWHLIPFHSDASEQVLEMCRAALSAETRAIVDAADVSMVRQARRDGRPYTREQIESRIRAAASRATLLLADAQAAACVFGIDLPFTDMLRTVRGLQGDAHRRAAVYAAMTDAVRGTPMGRAASDDAVPPSILADWIEDQTGADMFPVHEIFAD